LELRKALLQEKSKGRADWLQILLPCLGHQSCGALSNPEDWCHEEVTWWRPPYFRTIDKMAGLDRKTLPFSYLVIAKSKRSREELLPALASAGPTTTHRLVSPAHSEGRDLEFYLCGQDGKKRARFRPTGATSEDLNADSENQSDTAKEAPYLQRGDILLGAETRGDSQSTRVEKIKKKA